MTLLKLVKNAKIIKNGVFVECWHYETLIFSFDTSSLKAEIMLDLSSTSNRQIKDLIRFYDPTTIINLNHNCAKYAKNSFSEPR